MKSLLYILLRDWILPGNMEAIVRDLEKSSGKEVTYSNEHLAAYAEEIEKRLQGVR